MRKLTTAAFLAFVTIPTLALAETGGAAAGAAAGGVAGAAVGGPVGAAVGAGVGRQPATPHPGLTVRR